MANNKTTMARRAGRLLLIVLMSGWLSACALTPDYQRPALDLPDADSPAAAARAEQQRQAMVDWWQRFDDPVLDKLIQTALNENLNIALQASRIRQARAQLGLARAQFFPTIGGQFNASRSQASVLANPVSAGSRYRDNYAVSAALDYEINLFSALAGHEAAQAQLLATAYSYDALRLSVVGDIVANYMSLRSTQRNIRITRATIKSRTESFELAQKRYQFGAIDKLTLLQQKALLAEVRSRLPQLQEQASQLESALAILTGMTPREIMQDADIAPAPLSDITLPGDLPALLPSVLVNRRPDIRAAEAQLVAADAAVSVAKAQYFPTLNLTALIGTAAPGFGDLFGALSGTGSLGGSLLAPLLSFGRIAAQVDSAEEQRKQAVLAYRLTVRRAFGEVRDALIGVQVTQQRVEATKRQVEAYQQTLALARDRYNVGRVGLGDVLEAQRQLYSAQLALSGAIRDRFVATANLFKALGGGWTLATDAVPDDVDTGVPDVPAVEAPAGQV